MGTVVKVENEAPARWRKPPETATPSTLDKRASPRLYRFFEAGRRNRVDRNRTLSVAAELAATRREGFWQPHPCRPLGGSVPPNPRGILRHELAPMEGALQPSRKARHRVEPPQATIGH